jgi:hypothetical protein
VYRSTHEAKGRLNVEEPRWFWLRGWTCRESTDFA